MAYDNLRDLILSMYPKYVKRLINHRKKRIRKKYSWLKQLDNKFWSE